MNRVIVPLFCCLVLLCCMPLAMADHLLLQVEDFSGPWKKQTNISGYIGKGFRTSNANPNIAETVMQRDAQIETGGAHTVWVRAYTSENSKRALQVAVNGQKLAVTHTEMERHWSWQLAGQVELAAGNITVTVHDAADGFESADAVLITDRTDYDPSQAEAEEKQWKVYGGKPPKQASALTHVIEASIAELQKRTPPKDKTEWDARHPILKKQLLQAFGLDPLPERTPLNAKVTGKVEREGYTIENVVFESRPKFYVTANLYIPKGVTLPAPAIVVVPGHAMEDAKNYGLYNKAELGFVRQGIIVLAYDPIGQGERRQPGFEHQRGYGSLLVGQTNEGMIIWDTMRCVDYLETRPEVDQARMGLAGNSGGGENTFYTMPLEPRFKVGTAFCFTCSYEDFVRDGGGHCICNHFPNIFLQMEQFEILGMTAPRAFLAGNGAKDPIFPIAGTRLTIQRAKAIYAYQNAAADLTGVEVDAGHGWNQELREAGYGWMAKYLLDEGDGSPIPEGAYEPEDPKSPDVLVFDGTGLPEDAETVVSLNLKRAKALREAYSTPPEKKRAVKKWAKTLRKDLWAVFGGEPEAYKVSAEVRNTFTWENCTVEALSINTEENLVIPAFFIQPEGLTKPAPAVLYVREDEKNAVRNDAAIRALLDQGQCVLAIDPRGSGEVTVNANHLASDTVCLGRPLFAQQMWDVLQAARYLKARDEVAKKQVACYGRESGALLAIFAQALQPEFSRIVAERPLASFLYYFENTQPQPYLLGVPNLLKVADAPQAAALAAPTPLLVVNPVGFGRTPLPQETAADEYAFAQAVYALSKGIDALQVLEAGETAASDAAEAFLE